MMDDTKKELSAEKTEIKESGERPIPPKQEYIKEPEEKKKTRFYIEPKGFCAKAALVCMGLAILFRLIGCWGMWKEQTALYTQILLPIAAILLFSATILLGRHALWTTVFPVLLGCVFFVIRILGMTSRFSLVHVILCICMYTMIFGLWTGTVFGAIKTKWLLVPLFGLPFLYHVFVEDLQALQDPNVVVTFQAGLQEISVLFIMLGMLFTAIGMKKKKPEEPKPELPKMKAPKVIVKEKSEEEPSKEEK